MNKDAYEEALAAFEVLGDYKDSPEYVGEAKNEIQKQKSYDEAAVLLNNGDYEKAAEAFEALGEYKDSAAQAKEARDEIQKQKSYDEAVALLNRNEYRKAAEAFEALGNYKDSAAQAKEARDKDIYILTVTSVPIDSIDPLVFFNIVLQEESGTETIVPDLASMFENAEFVTGFAAGIQISIRVVNDKFVLELNEDSMTGVTYSVGGKNYEFGFGIGTRIAVNKTDGGYNLLPEQTAAMSPPPERD